MSLFFEVLGSFIFGVLQLLNGFTFEVGGFRVSWLGLMFGFFVVSLAMGFFWKGGK